MDDFVNQYYKCIAKIINEQKINTKDLYNYFDENNIDYHDLKKIID